MFSIDLIQQIKEWKRGSTLPICLGCDVGGSGLRVRLSDFHDSAKYVDLGHAKAQKTAELLKVLEDLQQKILQVEPTTVCLGAAIAVAGPIKNNTVILTNWKGPAEERTLSITQLPKGLFPKDRSYFLNDLEAGAYGVIAAYEQSILEENFVQLFTDRAPTGPILAKGRTAVLAMGSGLGAALVTRTPLLKNPLVLPTELGHLQIAPNMATHKYFQDEQELIQHISDHYYGGKLDPEYEDICSGRGLQLAFQFYHKKLTGEVLPLEQIDAGDVAKKAIAGEKDAYNALRAHYIFYLRAAKAIATSLSCESCVLSLDNQVKNHPFVMKIAKELEEEFYEFIRPDWMTSVRVYSQKSILNFNILGTDYMAHAIANKPQ
uniref:Glucokinase 1 n=1 Tax=Trichomonas vaginalis TaxID=5722 RepID=GLK1_TRIVA|nr:RecName: Full=Glucokinase 1; AltName: Full=Glucose kinase 1; AltName: Full=Hexokinase-1 [Trichomonas vaginalis]AAG17616.1 glucokinase [Trichomonas vaginalis]